MAKCLTSKCPTKATPRFLRRQHHNRKSSQTAQNEKPECPVLMDPTYAATNRWKVKAVSSFFMIKNGEIRWNITGTIKLDNLENAHLENKLDYPNNQKSIKSLILDIAVETLNCFFQGQFDFRQNLFTEE